MFTSLKHPAMRRAARVLAITVAADVAFGVWFGIEQHVGVFSGLYFATTTATTVGYGDLTPGDVTGRIIALLIMVTVVPLFTSVFSLISAGLTIIHVDRKHEVLKKHITESTSGQPDGSTKSPGESDPH
jgi:voltage-gated potassium channel